ncbi:MAG: anti-sigma factor [Trueperaceae bacterium]|nr:anti-sigma factor [Trueperaceae bacterium]
MNPDDPAGHDDGATHRPTADVGRPAEDWVAAHDDLTAYALGELEAADARRVEDYLAWSDAGRAEVRAIGAALVAVVEAVPQRAPSPVVWGRVEAAVAEERRKESAATAGRRRHTPASAAGRARRRWARPASGWLAAACLALLSVTAGVGGLLGVRSASAETAARERRVSEALSAPDMQRVVLYGAAEPGGPETALGSVVLRGDRALFVMTEGAGRGRAYQAWGHRSLDWEPGGDDRLTSLGTSTSSVLDVPITSFAALYLSREPSRGSDQPTVPLARVSLIDPIADRPLTIVQPTSGAAASGSMIVRGLVDTSVASVTYRLNEEGAIDVAVVGGRFTFTIPGLSAGEHALVVTATLRTGGAVEERIRLVAP